MKINSIADIVNAKILNSPSVSFIYNIKTNPNKIKDGDMFIAFNEEDISTAVKNGAYCILTNYDTIIIDSEIAWLKVSSLEDAIIKLIRFNLAKYDLNAYYCDKITFELLKLYQKSSQNIILFSTDLIANLERLAKIDNEKFIFCYSKNLLDDLYPLNANFNNTYEIKNLIAHSLFESSFSYNEHYFKKIRVPKIFINQFLDVYTLFGEKLDFHKLFNFPHLNPIFINRFNQVTSFGKTNKFIIAEEDFVIASKILEFIATSYTYGEILFVTKTAFPFFTQEQLFYNNDEELKQIIKTNYFNLLFVVGEDNNKILSLLNSATNETKNLFEI